MSLCHADLWCSRGHRALIPPFCCASMSAGSGGEETRLSSRQRDRERGVASYNIPLDVWDKRAEAGETRPPNLRADGPCVPRERGERVCGRSSSQEKPHQGTPDFVPTIFFMAHNLGKWKYTSMHKNIPDFQTQRTQFVCRLTKFTGGCGARKHTQSTTCHGPLQTNRKKTVWLCEI